MTQELANPEMDPLSEKQVQVANLSASGNTIGEIVAITSLHEELIMNILDLPNVKRYRQITVDNLEMDVNIKRLSGGKKVLDRVIKGVEEIVNTVESKKWNMVTFKMFEWLSKEIPKLQKETGRIQATQITINNDKKSDAKTSELDLLLEALPLEKKLEYFRQSEAILRAMVSEIHSGEIIDTTTDDKHNS